MADHLALIHRKSSPVLSLLGLVEMKAYLDANDVPFKDGSGNYTVLQVRQAMDICLNRGK